MTSNAPAFSNAQLQSCLHEVQTALRAQDMARALRLSDEAVARGIEHPNLLVLAAYHQRDNGQPEQGLRLAERAREIAPRNVDVLNAVGNCLVRLGRHREALKPFDAALRESPSAHLVRFNRATALEELQELDRARVEFERIVETHPDHVESLAHLATLAAQRGDMAVAREYANQAVRREPWQPAAQLMLATADIASGDHKSALPRLDGLMRNAALTPTNLSIAQGLKADALDALDRTAEAFRAYTQSQATQRAAHAAEFARPEQESAAALASRLIRYFQDADRDSWSAKNEPASRAEVETHAFLVGFPRSGTTMLEQILAGHPEIETMSERSCLIEALNRFTVPSDGLKELESQRGEDLAPWRAAYWKRVNEEGLAHDRRVFVDKMPLYSVSLCVIAKLFPGAKILFALRDPRDVVLSCFRRRFVMTQQMFELTTIETAADYYDRVMRLSELYRARLDLDLCELKHEDMVADINGETRRVCDFLNIAWNGGMTVFAQGAATRSVNTPSGPQLARGLSREGLAQWRRYRNELAPILPKLAPWVARFGYPED